MSHSRQRRGTGNRKPASTKSENPDAPNRQAVMPGGDKKPKPSTDHNGNNPRRIRPVEYVTAGLAIMAIIVSGFSAHYTSDQADIARNALEKTQRAFVTFGAPQIDRVAPDKDAWKVSLVLENAGGTATRHLKYVSGVWHEDLAFYRTAKVQPANPDVQEWKLSGNPTFNWSLGPKGKIVAAPFIVDEATIKRIRGGDLAFYVLAFTTYNDAFSEEVRKNRVCFKILGTSGNPGNIGAWGTERVELPEIPEPSSRPCFHNNCTDNECTENESAPPTKN